MCLLKSQLKQNLVMIYYKFNGDFKIHINLGRYKGNMGLEGQAAGHPNHTLSDEEVVPKEESTEGATAG
jgi:hypothetical protein